MKIIYREGDLLRSDIKVIGHCVNCHGVMGSGIARQIREEYPNVYQRYVRFVEDVLDEFLEREVILGEVQQVRVNPQDPNSRIVLNCFGQKDFGAHKVQVDYAAIRTCMREISSRFKDGIIPENYKKEVGFPLIGAGLAGGDWNLIEQIIEEEFIDVQPIVYKFVPGKV